MRNGFFPCLSASLRALLERREVHIFCGFFFLHMLFRDAGMTCACVNTCTVHVQDVFRQHIVALANFLTVTSSIIPHDQLSC